MKSLFTALAFLLPGLLSAAPTDKDVAHIAITQSDLENASRWGDIRKWASGAAERGMKTLVLEINVSQISAQDVLALAEEVAQLKLHTIAFINTSATGGGALLALACDEIWMAPGSRIGAAPPTMPKGEDLSPKVQDSMLAESLAVLKAGARSLAKLKGHRSEIADAFVDREKGYPPHAEKGELLLLDADAAAANAADGKPVLARGLAPDLKAIAKGAPLVALSADLAEKKPEDEDQGGSQI
jgi:membrane-bound serine protease (ClpP class)